MKRNASRTRIALEAEARAHCDAGRYEKAFEVALRGTKELTGYGPELFGFLVRCTPCRRDAEDVFQTATLALWRFLPRFEWRSSFRTLAYCLAVRAVNDFYRRDYVRPERDADPMTSRIAEIALESQSSTPGFERDRLQRLADERLRATLAPVDYVLVMLHVAEELSWAEVAQAMRGGEHEASAKEIDVWKQRYHRLKPRLRVWSDDVARYEGAIRTT